MILLLDNFDSFTYNLVDYFMQLGVNCKVIRNNVPLSEIKKHSYSGIVLSPGPESPDKAGCMMDVIGYYAEKLPILGICLGHQALGVHFGATLAKAQKPMHGKISSVGVSDDYIFSGLTPLTNVVRYHSLILTNLPECLTVTASTSDNEVMALKHNNLAIRGIQFHPEAVLTTTGIIMLKNWILFNNIANHA